MSRPERSRHSRWLPPGKWSARHVPTRTSQGGVGPSACRSARLARNRAAEERERAGPRRQARPVRQSGPAAAACRGAHPGMSYGGPGGSAAHTTPSTRTKAQAAIARPISVGSATATFAARLATLPATSSAHGSTPPRRPVRESASSVVNAATIMPSPENGVRTATQPGCPCRATSACICRQETVPANKCQQPHAGDSGPADPPVRARSHDRLPTANSPDSTHWDLGAFPPANKTPVSQDHRAGP
jgi:hypothetical protein